MKQLQPIQLKLPISAEGFDGNYPVTPSHEISIPEPRFHDGDSSDCIEFIKLQTYTRVSDSGKRDTVMVIGRNENNVFIVDSEGYVEYYELDGTGYDGSYLEFEDKPIPSFTLANLEDVGTANIKPFTVVKLRSGELAVTTSREDDLVYELQGITLSDQVYLYMDWCNGSQFFEGIESPNDIVGVYLNRDQLN